MSLLVMLTQVTPVSGAVCPGQDLVYSCNSTVSTNVLWRVTRGNDGFVSSQATASTGSQKYTLEPFIIQVVNRTFVPAATISTATLENALFFQNNTKIQCFSLNTVNPVLNDNDSAIVLISGELYQQ